MPATSVRLDFPGHSGASLSARLDKPLGEPRAYAIFAHCFTCSKDLVAVRRISAELVKSGIAVLRFDFTGLGSSEGDFASTNFSSNVEDLLSAAEYLRDHYRPASLLIGHSLGGAAVLEIGPDKVARRHGCTEAHRIRAVVLGRISFRARIQDPPVRR